jgi:hypothetical protein
MFSYKMPLLVELLNKKDTSKNDYILSQWLMRNLEMTKIHRLILATKLHKGTQRKKEYTNHTNEKLLEVQKPFLEKVFGRRRQRLMVDLG